LVRHKAEYLKCVGIKPHRSHLVHALNDEELDRQVEFCK